MVCAMTEEHITIILAPNVGGLEKLWHRAGRGDVVSVRELVELTKTEVPAEYAKLDQLPGIRVTYVDRGNREICLAWDREDRDG